VLNDPVNLVDPTGKYWQYVAVVVVVGGYAIKTWIKKWIEEKTSNAFYKKGFCKAYSTSKSCDAALLHMNGFCGTNVDCKDYSSDMYKKCNNGTLNCEEVKCRKTTNR
jgi:hypothetical protein